MVYPVLPFKRGFIRQYALKCRINLILYSLKICYAVGIIYADYTRLLLSYYVRRPVCSARKFTIAQTLRNIRRCKITAQLLPVTDKILIHIIPAEVVAACLRENIIFKLPHLSECTFAKCRRSMCIIKSRE